MEIISSFQGKILSICGRQLANWAVWECHCSNTPKSFTNRHYLT